MKDLGYLKDNYHVSYGMIEFGSELGTIMIAIHALHPTYTKKKIQIGFGFTMPVPFVLNRSRIGFG